MTIDAEQVRAPRADAERNRRKILDAAASVFAERGVTATVNEVALAAGVGVGTVYRKFPDK
jgi:AcrR family transcriptional regulator